MKQMTGLKRLLKTLNLEEPDRIPHLELGISRNVIEGIIQGASYPDFIEEMDLDGLVVFDKIGSWSYEKIDADKRIYRDQWGGLIQYGSEALAHPIAPAVKDPEDMKNIIPPDPDVEWRYKFLKKMVARFKGNKAVCAHVTDVFDVVKDSFFGDEFYFELLYTQPELIDQANSIVLEYHKGYIENCLEMGADILVITGDFAMTNGPFVSPEHTARFLTPPLKKMVDIAHKFNVPVIKHTDGDISKIIGHIVSTGIDAIHPIDPMAGMDLGKAKKQYGDQIALMGNVDCGPILSWGTSQEVRNEVKKCIREAGLGGGYICSSSNSIHSGVKPENYKIMIEAIREFGKYPLTIAES